MARRSFDEAGFLHCDRQLRLQYGDDLARRLDCVNAGVGESFRRSIHDNYFSPNEAKVISDRSKSNETCLYRPDCRHIHLSFRRVILARPDR
jgi:hypothetical protein